MELLHERLMDYASYDCGLAPLFHDFAVTGISELLEAFAHEIEQYYVPIPRYESGEPIREGDRTERGTVSSIDVYATWGNWGDWLIGFEEGGIYEGSLNQRMERFEPDSLERIELESEWDADYYAQQILGKTNEELSAHESDVHCWVAKDLLRRQKNILERS